MTPYESREPGPRLVSGTQLFLLALVPRRLGRAAPARSFVLSTLNLVRGVTSNAKAQVR